MASGERLELRVSAELLAGLDAARGGVPRATFARGLVERGLGLGEVSGGAEGGRAGVSSVGADRAGSSPVRPVPPRVPAADPPALADRVHVSPSLARFSSG